MIVHYNPLEPQYAGGAESAIRDQSRALEQLGHEVRIEFSRPERACRQWKPDVIHFHTIHVDLGLNILRWAQKQKMPHCLSLHDYWPFCGDRMMMKQGAQRMNQRDESCSAVMGMCDGDCADKPASESIKSIVNGSPTITFNLYSAEIFRRHGVHIDAVIPHAIDLELFRPDHDKRNGVRIATTSAWPQYPTKGMRILREALKEIGQKATLIHGVPRCRVADELRKASIFVFPSCYEETWGLCLTEAMASGCACIASDVCGSRAQIEDGVNGLLFPNRDVSALAQAIQRFIEDESLRVRIGEAAREWTEQKCNFERMGRDYEEFYGRVINGGV